MTGALQSFVRRLDSVRMKPSAERILQESSRRGHLNLN
jgi:hypothetical protein